jgi:large subunit ribosomal protein L21
MYAVVEIAGQQFVVAPNQTLTVPKLDSNVGDTVEFSNVVLTSNNGSVNVGTPYVKATVKATVNDHGKGEKILVFHKKRRKGYQKLNGHRSHFTTITINAINV